MQKDVATTLIENAQASIEQEKQAALAEIKKSVADLSYWDCRICYQKRISF